MMIFKRLLAGLLLTLGLSAGTLGLVAAPAMADTATTGYGSTTNPTTAPGSSTTDPCLTGNGTTGTTNGNCLPGTSPNSGGANGTPEAAGTAAALGSTSSNGSLAFTGTDIVGTVIVAFVLIGGGLVILRLSRRKNAA